MATREKPPWLKRRLRFGEGFRGTREALEEWGVSTVCVEAECPNRGECWSAGTATFQVLGEGCSRECGFCAVEGGPEPVDPSEPGRVAAAAEAVGLEHAVVTCVTRDDLPKGGSGHIAECVEALKGVVDSVEVLVPDFRGDREALGRVVDAGPDVLGHNLETVERLQGEVRGGEASYRRSLGVLESAKEEGVPLTKSSLMLGLGEERWEVLEAMRDLRERGVDILTVGQYLRPSPGKLPVERWVTPGEFRELESAGEEMGFGAVEAGPFVRSSYGAGSLITKLGGGRVD